MDTVDEVRCVAEVGCVVDFVFEEYTCDPVGNERGWVVGIGRGEKEVGRDGAGLEGEHESCYTRGWKLAACVCKKVMVCGKGVSVQGQRTSLLHVRVTDDFPPHLDGVAREPILAGRFFVLSV